MSAMAKNGRRAWLLCGALHKGPLSGVRFYPEWRPDAAFLADDIGAADSA
jgi:hypothetical protein